MTTGLSAKLVSLFLVLSVCLLGYVSMSAFAAHPFPVPGDISIDPETTIYQSSTPGSVVQIFFADSDETLNNLTVDADYIQVNKGTMIGVHSLVNCELNLTSWEPAALETRGTVAEFSINSAGNWVPFSIYLGNLKVGYIYRVLIDGNPGPVLVAGATGGASFVYSGNPGTHDFEVRQFYYTPQISSLLNVIVLVIAIGIVMGVAGEGIYSLRKQKERTPQEMMRSLFNMVLYIVIGLSILGTIYIIIS